MGVDAAGNTTVVYCVVDDGDDLYGTGGIYARYRPAQGVWSEPQLISTQTSKLSAGNVGPELAVASSGRAVLATDAGLYERAPGATTFTAVPNTADVVHVAMNAAGHIAAAYKTTGADWSTRNLSVRVKTAGGAWQAPQPLGLLFAATPDSGQDRSRLVVTDDGTVVVGWDEGAAGDRAHQPGHGVNVSIRTSGSSFGTGTWTTTENVNGTAGQPETGFPLRVTIDNARQAVVSWQRGTYADGSAWSLQGLFPGGPAPAKVTAGGSTAVSQAAGGRALRVPPSDGADITARVRPAAGRPFGDLLTVIKASSSGRYANESTLVALDDQGNGYIAWARFGIPSTTGASQLVGVSGYDPVAPVITSVAAMPAPAGSPTALVAAATDRMSNPTFTWTFGDGSPSEAGAAVSHLRRAGHVPGEGDREGRGR